MTTTGATMGSFWRLEQRPLALITHVLGGAVYRETGRFDDVVTVTEPVSVSFRLSDLLRR